MSATLVIILIVLGFLLALAGLIGCLLPVIPGPPLSFLALLFLSLAKDWEPFSATFLVVMGCLTAAVAVMDYLIPIKGAQRYGASRHGIWGSIIGMLLGMFFFPPLGMILGAFVGALLGELFAGREGRQALRAGWGTFVGTVASTILKVVFGGVVLFFYVKAMF
jgi:uncharacterized protein YqgC (DUF456 family)